MKRTMHIFLQSVDDIKKIASVARKMEGTVTISDGWHCIDAKSVLGIYVLNLSGPLSLKIENWREEYSEALEPYTV